MTDPPTNVAKVLSFYSEAAVRIVEQTEQIIALLAEGEYPSTSQLTLGVKLEVKYNLDTSVSIFIRSDDRSLLKDAQRLFSTRGLLTWHGDDGRNITYLLITIEA